VPYNSCRHLWHTLWNCNKVVQFGPVSLVIIESAKKDFQLNFSRSTESWTSCFLGISVGSLVPLINSKYGNFSRLSKFKSNFPAVENQIGN